MQENIGKRIKNVRKNLSLSQTEFASGLNISQSAISAYEKTNVYLLKMFLTKYLINTVSISNIYLMVKSLFF